MHYSFYKTADKFAAFVAKHKHRRANPDMIQAILFVLQTPAGKPRHDASHITRSINVCRQMLICGKTQTPAGKPRHDTSHTMYYSFYKRVQTNAAFVTKHKHRRANSGVIQTQKTGLKTQAFYVPLACAENYAILASPKTQSKRV